MQPSVFQIVSSETKHTLKYLYMILSSSLTLIEILNFNPSFFWPVDVGSKSFVNISKYIQINNMFRLNMLAYFFNVF